VGSRRNNFQHAQTIWKFSKLELLNHYLFLPTLVVIILLAQLLSRTRRVWQTQHFRLQPAAVDLTARRALEAAWQAVEKRLISEYHV
jgi:hypothetical protein